MTPFRIAESLGISPIQFLTEDIAIGRIVETIGQTSPGKSTFVLIVGAGFSYGLAPLAADIVVKELPRLNDSFVSCQPPQMPPGRALSQIQRSQQLQKQWYEEENERKTASFWKRFLEENKANGWRLELNHKGIPTDIGLAYQYVFHEKSVWPFQNSAGQRRFLQNVIQPNRYRLNPAHFFLASILGAQPGIDGKNQKRKSESLFNFQGAFSRCILTTNFDPFLQIALQSVNRLYFMSDTPDLENEDLTDEGTDAIHLVYVHGSIHRHRQDNSEEQIRERKKIAQQLVPLFERHGIIVMGYSGWDDAITEALAKCQNFSPLGLYWINRCPNPSAKGAFGTQVPNILSKPNAFYVHANAGMFMNKLHSHLVRQIPRLLENPIGQLRELLTIIDFEDLELAETNAGLNDDAPFPKDRLGKSTFKDFKTFTLESLKVAENSFESHRASKKLEIAARFAFQMKQHSETIRYCNLGLAKNPPSNEQATFYELRAFAFMQADIPDEALNDFRRVIEELPGVPTAIRMHSLRWRATLLFELGRYNETITDLTTLIQAGLDGNKDHQVNLRMWRARALRNCGGKKNMCRAIVDYNQIIKSPFRPAAGEKEFALFERATVWPEIGQFQRGIADYTKIIERLQAQAGARITHSWKFDLLAKSLCNRGYAYGWQGEYSKAMIDLNSVIDGLPGVSFPCERMADALSCRGWLYYKQRNYQQFLSDIKASLQKSPSAHPSMYHLGLALLANGRDEDDLAAYKSAAEKYPQLSIEFGITDLKEAVSSWLTSERAQPCIQFLASLNGA